MAKTTLEVNNLEFTACSLYCPPNGDMRASLQDLERVVGSLNHARIFVGMDANARSRVWYSDRDCDRGDLPNDFMVSHDLREQALQQHYV